MPTADDFINESKKIFLQRMLTLDFFLLLRAKSENLLPASYLLYYLNYQALLKSTK